MKKSCLLFFVIGFCFFCSTSYSQKGIKGLVNAEKAFATFTKTHTVRDGFLQFMDSTGIIFREGNAINAFEFYQKQNPNAAILSWTPSFAVISASGEMGVTTGPYELRSGSIQDSSVSCGFFSSIWQLNKNGLWKNMVDLGISYKKRSPLVDTVYKIKLPKTKNIYRTPIEDIISLDNKFNTAISEKNYGFLIAYLSPETRLNIVGEKPVAGHSASFNSLQFISKNVKLNAVSGKVSAAGDFAYVYGTVTNRNKKQNYLRVWIYQNDQWQVILQTIQL